jgi:protein tyrosine/serine phosphatase
MKLSAAFLPLAVVIPAATAFAPTSTNLYYTNTRTVTTTTVTTLASTSTTPANERTPAEEEFFTCTKKLCTERNISLQKIKNARDLSSVRNSPVKPNRLFRTGRVSDATPDDLKVLFDEMKIKTLVDLRSPTELKDDVTLDRPEVFGDFKTLIWDERKGGLVKELNVGETIMTKKKKNVLKLLLEKRSSEEEEEEEVIEVRDDCLLTSAADVAGRITDCEEDAIIIESLPEDAITLLDEEDDDELEEHADTDADATPDNGKKRKKRFAKVYPPGTIYHDKTRAERKERHFVSIMNELKYVKGTVSKVRKRDIAKVIIESPGALVSKRVRGHIKKPFLDEINGGGLPMLNELLLQYGAPGIHYVLDLCKDRNRHPVAFYCTAGKDRTGMIAALMLSAVGVEEEDIVEDYSLSANVYAEMGDHKAMVGALSQRSLDAKTFLGAPPQVMRDTLKTINEKWGSVNGYLDWIGFGEDDRKQLKSALLDP